jgi:hypothetical protein
MHVSKTGKWLIVAGGLLLIGQVLLTWGVETLWAQAKGERTVAAYQYVGVEQTIARVDTATGKIEVLSKQGETRASLLTRDARAWEWREIPLRAERYPAEVKIEPPVEQPKNPMKPSEEVPNTER